MTRYITSIKSLYCVIIIIPVISSYLWVINIIVLNCQKLVYTGLGQSLWQSMMRLVINRFQTVWDPTLHKMVHIGEMQFSFVPGGGTTDAIFFVCQLQEWVIKFNCHLGTADIRVRIVHTSCVIIAYTLESLSSLTQVTHNLQVTINFNNFFFTLKWRTGALEAQVPIQNYLYPSIFIRSAQCFWYSSKILF